FVRMHGAGGEPDAYTYGELWRAAAAFAEAAEGVEPGTLALLVMPLGKSLLAAHLGMQMQGLVPSIYTHPSEKIQQDAYLRNLRHALGLLRPGIIIAARQFAQTVRESLPEAARARLVLAEEVAEASGFEARAWRSASPDSVAIVQHSSGSTGLQKGVALTHAMVAAQCATYARFIGLDAERDRVCAWLPLYHDMGLFTSWLMPVLHGVPVSLLDPFEWVKQPASLLELIERERGTLCWQPNFAFSLLAKRRPAGRAPDLRSMRGFTNCSEPVTGAAMRAFLEAYRDSGVAPERLWACYAMAENAFAVTAAGGAGEGALADRVSCGKPLESVELRIVDAARRDLPEGSTGEIALRSPFALREYFRNPEATAEAIDAERWYYTGDLGFLDRGELYVTGRKKDLIIIAGRNFYPQDLERVADECAGAIEGRSVAFGVDDAALGTQKAVMLVESKLASEAERDALAASVREAAFSRLDCPVASVQVVPHMSLLKTSSGKISRQANRERYLAGLSAAQPAARLPATGTRRRAGLAEMLLWSFAAAAALYLAVLIVVLGTNESWNIYAGF
ncbi:MAG TPA: AMP-binding protein, partial [Burkholderiales bacterium]|nr:AMP-binding protein [Burkholderiales bacterium]